MNVEKLINGAIFTQETNSMVIVKNIEVYSLCEHHMLPFFRRCHIGSPERPRVRRQQAGAAGRCTRAGCSCRNA
jgi:GTP cyclohydrolase I